MLGRIGFWGEGPPKSPKKRAFAGECLQKFGPKNALAGRDISAYIAVTGSALSEVEKCDFSQIGGSPRVRNQLWVMFASSAWSMVTLTPPKEKKTDIGPVPVEAKKHKMVTPLSGCWAMWGLLQHRC